MTTILQRTPIQVVFGPCWSVGDHQELSLAANEVPRVVTGSGRLRWRRAARLRQNDAHWASSRRRCTRRTAMRSSVTGFLRSVASARSATSSTASCSWRRHRTSRGRSCTSTVARSPGTDRAPGEARLGLQAAYAEVLPKIWEVVRWGTRPHRGLASATPSLPLPGRSDTAAVPPAARAGQQEGAIMTTTTEGSSRTAHVLALMK
jgi:hypothetical protein